MSKKKLVPEHYNKGKPAMEMVPFNALLSVADVMGYGETKYVRKSPDELNYLHGKGVEPKELLAGAMRHIAKYMLGQEYDDESGMHHIAHAASDCMMALEVIYKRKGQNIKTLRKNDK